MKTLKMNYKVIIKMLIICVVALFFSCGEKKGSEGGNCEIIIPKDLKPIDYDNYNDVYTVYWSFVKLCSENNDYKDKIVKISGWRPWSYDLFYLCDDPKYAVRDLGHAAASPIVKIRLELPENSAHLNNPDWSKKCFIKGELLFYHLEMGSCCKLLPEIVIKDIDDIYFEEQEDQQ